MVSARLVNPFDVEDWGASVPIGKYIPAVILTICCTVALVAGAMHAPTAPGASVAIMFPPRTTLVEAVAAVGKAGGVVERTGRWDNIVVASFPGREPPVDTLEASGALLVFNALVAGGCGAVPLQAQDQALITDRRAGDEGLKS